MRQAEVLYKNAAAGLLTQLDNGSFIFRYYDQWFESKDKPSISLTLPKNQQEYESKYLFPIFTTCYLKVLTNRISVLNCE